MPCRLVPCDLGPGGGNPWFPHGTLLLRSLAGLVVWVFLFGFVVLPYHTEMTQSYHLLRWTDKKQRAPAEDHTSKLKEYGNSVCTSDTRVIACTTRYPTTSTLIVRREAEREGAKQIKRTETNSNQQTHTTKRATDRHKQQEKEHSGMQRPRRGTRYIHKLAGKCRSLSK